MQIRKLFSIFSNCFCLLLVNVYAVNGQNTANLPVGKFLKMKTDQQNLFINTQNAFVSVKVCSPNLIRVNISKIQPGYDFSYAVIGEQQKTSTNITENKNEIIVTTDSIKLIIGKEDMRFSFFNIEGKLINTDESFGTQFTGNEISAYKKIFDTERFIGLGEKTGNLDRRGNGYVNWNTDCYGYGPETDPMYVSIPFYIGIHDSLCYGIFLDNTSKTHFNFGASNTRFSSFTVEDGDLNYYFIYHSDIAGIINTYTDLTGKTPMPAQWSLGFQQCRWSYFPDTEVLNIANTFREKEIPLDVIYLDIHYMDSYKIFTWNNKRFPQPQKMMDELKQMRIRTAIIVDPGIKVENGYSSYEEGTSKNLFLKYPDGSNYSASVWPGVCNFPDFTMAESRTWWGNSFKNYVDEGVMGFWNDMNEPATWGQKFPSLVEFDFDTHGGTALTGRNIYGMQMARATYEGTKKLLNGKRPFVLTRSGFAGIQRYSAVWTGDNTPTDDHLLLGVRLVNSLGISGVANCGVDVGGFSAEATKELYTRWITVGVFSPFFRSHKMYNLKASEPWSYGEEAEEISKYFIQLRYKLMPYLYSKFYEATVTGIPINRTLAIHYSFDNTVYNTTYQNQYFFGDAILVAPVKSTDNFCKIYFPENNYYDFYNDSYFKRNTETVVESPLYRLPLFVKEGSIIPMQTVVQSFDDKPSDTLIIHLYAGEVNNEFMYYEDDGETYAYEKGAYYLRKLIYKGEENIFRIEKSEGNYVSQFKNIELIFHGFDFTAIKINNNSVEIKDEKISMVYPDAAAEILYYATPDRCSIKSVVFKNSNEVLEVKW